MRRTIVFDIGLWPLSEEDNIRKVLAKFGWAYCFSNTSTKYRHGKSDSTKKFLQIHCYTENEYQDLSEFWREYNILKEGKKEPTLIEQIGALKDQAKLNAIYDLLVMNATQRE